MSTAKFQGYCDKLPVADGDVVTILKGTRIKTTHPSKKEKVANRTYKVKVHHVLPGMDAHLSYRKETVSAVNPSVRWAGEGGYWHEVDINDVPEARK